MTNNEITPSLPVRIWHVINTIKTIKNSAIFDKSIKCIRLSI